MPRGSRFPVAGLEAVAYVTVRAICRLAGGRDREGKRRSEEGDELEKNGAGSEQRKVERIPEETAIFSLLEELSGVAGREGFVIPF